MVAGRAREAANGDKRILFSIAETTDTVLWPSAGSSTTVRGRYTASIVPRLLVEGVCHYGTVSGSFANHFCPHGR